MFPNVGFTSDVPSDTASTDGAKIISITAAREVAILYGQIDRVFLFTPESSVSVDSPTFLAYGSEVSVVVDEGAFQDMARHCLVPWKASSECVRRDKTRGIWLSNKNRWVRESSLQTCKYVLSLGPMRGGSRHDKRNSREAKSSR